MRPELCCLSLIIVTWAMANPSVAEADPPIPEALRIPDVHSIRAGRRIREDLLIPEVLRTHGVHSIRAGRPIHEAPLTHAGPTTRAALATRPGLSIGVAADAGMSDPLRLPMRERAIQCL